MGLKIECPVCKYLNSEKTKKCQGKLIVCPGCKAKYYDKNKCCPECKEPKPKKEEREKVGCGFNLSKFSGRIYWIEFYNLEGKRQRERIGNDKGTAEYDLRKKLKNRTEGRRIDKSPDSFTRLKTLAEWYLNLDEVKAKDSYRRDEQSLKRLLPFFGELFLKDIIPAQISAYQQQRITEPSGRSPKHLTKPATVNREIACLRTIFNMAIANGKAEGYPFKRRGKKSIMLPENNERDRILSPEEYATLLVHCPPHLKPIVKLAYHTAMRQGEILNLTWGQVDLKEGFIRLKAEDTKTNEGRLVPLNGELVEILKTLRNGFPLPQVRVFTYAGHSVGSIKRSFETAVNKAGIEDFTFHDLRHTAINNWRLQGHDYFRIMSASGHKTMHVFKRYNSVSKVELKALVGEKPV